MTQYTDDPFSNNIIQDIPKIIWDSFTADQSNALLDALRKERINARHLINSRFTIPLFFTRYYTVFLLGKDHRAHSQETLVNRRRKGSLFTSIAFAFLLILNTGIVLLLLTLLSTYLAKSMLGIDLFPNMHLWDFLTNEVNLMTTFLLPIL
jgi:hypothetical protein